MTPDTVHLLAQLLRHHRAIVTAVSKWAQKQPSSSTVAELHQIVRFTRDMLDEYERQLTGVDVEQVEDEVRV